MKFLCDHDVYASTSRFLKELGHDVVLVSDIGMSRADDEELLNLAHEQDRIFVTRDRDYGQLIFVQKLGAGALYLRILPSNLQSVHSELKRVLETYPEAELKNAFVVIEPGTHRIRKPLN